MSTDAYMLKKKKRQENSGHEQNPLSASLPAACSSLDLLSLASLPSKHLSHLFPPAPTPRSREETGSAHVWSQASGGTKRRPLVS